MPLGFTFQGDSLSPSYSGPSTSGNLGIVIQGITTGGYAAASGPQLTQSPISTGALDTGLSSSPGLTSLPGGLAVPGLAATATGSSPLLLLAALAIGAWFLLRK